MQISPNVMLTGKYIAAGATAAVGLNAMWDADVSSDGGIKGAIGFAGGVAATAAGGLMALHGYQQLGNLGTASGGSTGAMLLKSVGMLAAGFGTAFLVNEGLKD